MTVVQTVALPISPPGRSDGGKSWDVPSTIDASFDNRSPHARRAAWREAAHPPPAPTHALARRQKGAGHHLPCGALPKAPPADHHQWNGRHPHQHATEMLQVGRAPCRERVGHYVVIAAVARTLTKTKR